MENKEIYTVLPEKKIEMLDAPVLRVEPKAIGGRCRLWLEVSLKYLKHVGKCFGDGLFGDTVR